MTDLSAVRELAGLGGVVLAVAVLPAAAYWVVLVGLTARRWRVPAVLWLAPGALALLPAVVAGLTTPDWSTGADPSVLPALGSAALARILAPRGLGWLWASLWCGASAWGLAIAAAARPERPRTRVVDALLPALAGGAGLLLAIGVALGSRPSLLGGLVVLGTAASAVLASSAAALRGSSDPTTGARLGAARAGVLALGLGAVAGAALGWHDLARALASPDDPGALGRALDPRILPTGGAALLAVAAAGLPGLSTARGAIGTLRSLGSGGALAGLGIVTAAMVALSGPGAAIRDAAAGGAVAAIDVPLWTRLPRAADLQEQPATTDPLDATCLITEAADGWTAGPMFLALSPAAHVARNSDPDATDRLDREAGCPGAPAPLDAPLAASEIPVIALDGDRAAAALSGAAWFRERGPLRVLVQPDPIASAGWSDAAARRVATAVPFLWSLPEPMFLPPDHDFSVWDEARAAKLPVTILEGPYPVLVAGGLHSRLPAGALGAETLQLALSSEPPERRDLWLIPRKTWTVQDLVRFCATARDHVEDVRCVVSPETPARWALRTGQPLPW